MNNRMNQLKHAIQILALPVSGQVSLFPDDCTRIEILTRLFDASHEALRADVTESMSTAQLIALIRLGNQLAYLRQSTLSPLCSELSMRQSSEWRQLRTMARQALVSFRWALEIPGRDLTEPAV
jgi:hypothetical protein